MHNVTYIVTAAENHTKAVEYVEQMLNDMIKYPLSKFNHFNIEAVKEKDADAIVDLITDKRYGIPDEGKLIKLYKELLEDKTLLQNSSYNSIKIEYLRRFANIGKILLINANNVLKDIIDIIKDDEYTMNIEYISSYLVGLQTTNLHKVGYNIWEGNYLPYQFHLPMSLTQFAANCYPGIECKNSYDLKKYFIVVDIYT